MVQIQARTQQFQNTTTNPVVASCSYGTAASSSSGECPMKFTKAQQEPGKVSTSSTFGAYASYIASLHRNTYASYIRLQELEKIWGMWTHRAKGGNSVMPFDHVESAINITNPEGKLIYTSTTLTFNAIDL